MLDIKFIKDNIDYVKTRLNDRNDSENKYAKDIDNAVEFYAKRNELIYNNELLKAKQNQVSKEVPVLKKEGKDTKSLLQEMKNLSEEIKDADILIKDIDERITGILMNIPNLPDKSVPAGKNEKENQVVKIIGEPRKFDFIPLPHWELGEKLGILDPERAAKVTGTRFHFYVGDGARLERAIVNYFLDMHAKSGYTEIFTPFIVNRKSMTGTGQLPKFEEDSFKLSGFDYFLIPTTEVPLTNYHSDEILMFGENETAKNYCGFSTNFRSEAGSAGRDTRGLIRQHQFNKVELVKFAIPENSYDELEKLTANAEGILQELKLPYRVVNLCGGDLGFANSKTYDIEVWMPSYNRYVEISSCSNYETFQARRAGIRFKDNPADKPSFAHTLNGSALAVGRTAAAIMENYQQPDGNIKIPEVLVPYMGGVTEIS